MSSSLARLKSPWALLAFAIGLAAVVAWIAYGYLQQREERIKEELAASNSRRETPKVSVVVPIQDARIGVVIDPSAFVARDIEEDLIYPDTVLASDFDAVRGQRLARPMLRGRPLRVTDLQAPDVRDVASVLPAGKRAVTIEIDRVNSIAQSLRPGHRVDVFLMSKAAKAKAFDASDDALNQATLFMQNVAVLATGQEFQDINSANADRINKMARPGDIEGQHDKEFDTITVLVTPTEAARLLVGQKLGNFRVALRGAMDEELVAMQPLTGGDVLPPPKPGASASVEFIVGGKGVGSATLASTLVAMGLPNSAAGGLGPRPGASQQADVKAQVEQVIEGLATPRMRFHHDDRGLSGTAPVQR